MVNKLKLMFRCFLLTFDQYLPPSSELSPVLKIMSNMMNHRSLLQANDAEVVLILILIIRTQTQESISGKLQPLDF